MLYGIDIMTSSTLHLLRWGSAQTEDYLCLHLTFSWGLLQFFLSMRHTPRKAFFPVWTAFLHCNVDWVFFLKLPVSSSPKNLFEALTLFTTDNLPPQLVPSCSPDGTMKDAHTIPSSIISYQLPRSKHCFIMNLSWCLFCSSDGTTEDECNTVVPTKGKITY